MHKFRAPHFLRGLHFRPSRLPGQMTWKLTQPTGPSDIQIAPAANAREWVKGTSAGYEFSVPDGKAAYLVEAGNSPAFNRPPRRSCISLGSGHHHLVIATADKSDPPALASFYLNFCDSNGTPIDRLGIRLRAETTSTTFMAPAGTAAAAIAVRLTGQGTLPLLNLKLSNAPAEHPGDQENGDISPVIVARSEYERRNYSAAFRIIEPVRGTEAFRLQLDVLSKQRRFSSVLRAIYAVPHSLQTDLHVRIAQAEALANLGLSKDLSRLVEEAMASAERNDLLYLLSIFRHATSIAQSDAPKLRKLCAGAAGDPDAPFGAVVQCAHDLAGDGEISEARAVLDQLKGRNLTQGTVVRHAEIELLSCHINAADSRPREADEAFQRALKLFQLEPVSFQDHELRLDRIQTPDIEKIGIGPKVSVLMPARNSAGTISYAIRSVLAQTHSNLELIVVDDGSDDPTATIADHFRRQDRRVQVVRLGQPLGAYYARNEALFRADGDYVVVQDSDDWAHPRKLERLLGALRTNNESSAVKSLQIRVAADGGLVARHGYLRPDGSSFMFPRRKALDHIGYFDTPPAGADLEYQMRFERVFGPTLALDVPLSLVRASNFSLSATGLFAIDPDTGVFSAQRNAYRREFLKWHESAATLYIPHPLDQLRFPRSTFSASTHARP